MQSSLTCQKWTVLFLSLIIAVEIATALVHLYNIDCIRDEYMMTWPHVLKLTNTPELEKKYHGYEMYVVSEFHKTTHQLTVSALFFLILLILKATSGRECTLEPASTPEGRPEKTG